MKTPVTPEKMKDHLHYNWWKYVLLVVLTLSAWSIFFEVTAHRAPEDKRLAVLVYGLGESQEAQLWLDSVRERDFPDQEEFVVEYLTPDETYGSMVLSTRIFAGDGDLLILPREVAQSYMAEGFYQPLEETEGILALCEEMGINVERGWRRNTETGERHLLAIPVSGLPRVQGWLYNTAEDYYLGVRVSGGNDENAMALMKIILQDAAAGSAYSPQTPLVVTELPAAAP